MARGKKERKKKFIYRVTYEDTLGKWDAWEKIILFAYVRAYIVCCAVVDDEK